MLAIDVEKEIDHGGNHSNLQRAGRGVCVGQTGIVQCECRYRAGGCTGAPWVLLECAQLTANELCDAPDRSLLGVTLHCIEQAQAVVASLRVPQD